MGLVYEVDPRDLSKAGWGVIFAAQDDSAAAIKEALAPILELRREQVGHRYREYSGADGYRQGDSSLTFLSRHGMGSGVAEPEKMPYYLLIVAGPQEVPYRFQQQLDIQYAVGRIHFDGPTKQEVLERYANYAQSVVNAEKRRSHSTRRVAVFAPMHAGDPHSLVTAQYFARPLVEDITRHEEDWRVSSYIGEAATKRQLWQLLSGDERPAFLFATGHTVLLKNDDPRQHHCQGALICQDWPGPTLENVPVSTDMFFSADDVDDQARLLGLVTMYIASYSLGMTPVDMAAVQVQPASRPPFVSELPQRLLSHPKGGGLAVVGSVDLMWSIFSEEHVGRDSILPKLIEPYSRTIQQILAGFPIGFAVEYCQDRYVELATELNEMLDDIRFGRSYDDTALVEIFTAANNLKNLAVLGDPAVRIPIPV
jgi:hypothetical protein